jgi:hypothetical protein
MWCVGCACVCVLVVTAGPRREPLYTGGVKGQGVVVSGTIERSGSKIESLAYS